MSYMRDVKLRIEQHTGKLSWSEWAAIEAELKASYRNGYAARDREKRRRVTDALVSIHAEDQSHDQT